MTDQPPVFPAPEGTPPEPTASVPPIVPPTNPAPQASYPPPVYTAPSASPGQYGQPYPSQYGAIAPPRPPMSGTARALMIGGIVLGSAILLTGAIAGGIVLGTQVAPLEAEPQSEAEPEVGVPGPPGGPLDCPDACFNALDADGMVPSQAVLDALGTDREIPDATFRTTIVRDQRDFAQYWADDHGTPDECFFAYYGAPATEPLAPAPEKSDGAILYLAAYENARRTIQLSESIRTFPTSALAEQHVEKVGDLVSGCPHYSTDYWNSDLVLLEPLDLPDGVSGVGWIETSARGDSYLTYDLARGNLVVRNTMYSSDPSDESRFMTYLESQAELLAGLVPQE